MTVVWAFLILIYFDYYTERLLKKIAKTYFTVTEVRLKLEQVVDILLVFIYNWLGLIKFHTSYNTII